jgi:hypothetical protein
MVVWYHHTTDNTTIPSIYGTTTNNNKHTQNDSSMSKLVILPLCTLGGVGDDNGDDDVSTLSALPEELWEYHRPPSPTTDMTHQSLQAYDKLLVSVKTKLQQQCTSSSQSTTIRLQLHTTLIAQERFVVHWNRAGLWTRQAVRETAVQAVAATYGFTQAAQHIQTCRIILQQYQQQSSSSSSPLFVQEGPRNNNAAAAASAASNTTTTTTTDNPPHSLESGYHYDPPVPDLFHLYPDYTTDSFLQVYRMFVLAQVQRVMACHFLLPFFQSTNIQQEQKVVDHDRTRNVSKIISVGTAAIHLLSQVLELLKLQTDPDEFHTTQTVFQEWRTSALGWKLLLQTLVDYHRTLSVATTSTTSTSTTVEDDSSNVVVVPPQAKATLLLRRAQMHFTQLQAMSHPMIQSLVHKVRPKLLQVLNLSSSDINNNDENVDSMDKIHIPPVFPVYYVPSSMWNGMYSCTWTELTSDNADNKNDNDPINAKEALRRPSYGVVVHPPQSNISSASPTKNSFYAPPESKRSKSISVSETTINKSGDDDDNNMEYSASQIVPPATPKTVVAAPPDPFPIMMNVAKEKSKQLLVIVFGNDEAVNTSLKRLLIRNEVILEIVQQAYVTWKVHKEEIRAKSYLQTNKINQFPHVGIWISHTAELVWQCNDWSNSSSSTILLEERFAEAALSYGSFNPYEGLETHQQTVAPIIGAARPPTNLIHPEGGFRSVLETAWATRKYVLVNIQNDAVLTSHVLNRDVWHNDFVQELVRENFVFWQKFHVAVEGRLYVNLFQVKTFPHVAILNPFTGAIVWRKEGWIPGDKGELTADTFAEKVVQLPILEGEVPSISTSAAASTQGNQSSIGEKSWELVSLLESWERLSVGTLDDTEQLLDGEYMNVDNHGAVMEFDIPNESPLAKNL